MSGLIEKTQVIFLPLDASPRSPAYLCPHGSVFVEVVLFNKLPPRALAPVTACFYRLRPICRI